MTEETSSNKAQREQTPEERRERAKQLAVMNETRIDSDGVFASGASFALAQRQAQALASSSMVPMAYRLYDEKGTQNPDAVSNCLIALEYAARLRLSPLMVMQMVDMIHGRPSLRGQMAIALVNASGLFHPLQFEWVRDEKDNPKGCRVITKRRDAEVEVHGPWVTMDMVKAEGWKGKWLTIPELMFMYRSATFFARVHCPNVLLGMHVEGEVEDIIDVTPPPRRPSATALAERLAETEDDAEPPAGSPTPAEPPPPRKKKKKSAPAPAAAATPAAAPPAQEPPPPPPADGQTGLNLE